ncbi:MAG: methylated-DNA--[protein]-cysteine S-methyltransferase [Alphaproteobacteria bacterium]|nr:methylated-DNA--[protein]-cysteine S-methyltransferase [Alphaproteobacteria bacterium]MBU0798904.1 methylated-DNA--[protein]-cysteine S-methyltransferase [Alphaproteobacteria bacterium]MBU0886292.1 methylated-DNA--[protein]-cysteine S-methyltransferase [Alphaproteobacteria bacterium]MBU1813512.1 methylated-DNA--[protein]-cysteine S-methyltransferase [Alphaproteobacteria bacterium]MBU2090062.1 methylated-DNA--[protein]-cysteine S-methyltransferase [Alphaproteobacteria bacterium]
MTTLTLDTPVGPVTVYATDGAITRVRFGSKDGESVVDDPLLNTAAEQLTAYFAGQRTRFELPLEAAGSAHNKAVWDAMLRIPYGETRSYGDIAEEIGSNARAVGVACGSNPIPILIPCHRVVGKDGKLVGFSGGDGKKTKARLLDLEAPSLPLLSFS